MRSSTRTLVFRRHSCYYAELRPLVWHGIITANQANLSAGVEGLDRNFSCIRDRLCSIFAFRNVFTRHHTH